MGHALTAGLIAGSVSALAATGVSLPLRSPDDIIFNAATVTVGALIAGAASGLLWGMVGRGQNGLRLFVTLWCAAFVAVMVVAALGENVLERTFSFTTPLAAMTFAITGVLTPALAGAEITRWWMGPASLAAALAVGIPLAGVGDEESGRLSLPPAPARTSTPTPAPAPSSTSPSANATATPGTGAATTTPTTPPQPTGLPNVFTVGQGSEATFTVREKLARLPLPSDAVVRNTSLTGALRRNGPSVVEINLQQFTSDQALRDRYIRTTMFRNEQTATLTVDPTPPEPEGLAKGEAVPVTFTGTLRIKGKDVPLTFTGEARYDGPKLYVLGRTSFTWAELGLAPPNVANIVQVEDTVKAEVLIAAAP
jgi:hypothetical protein